MLVLLWVEFIFFAVAGTGLCSGFVLEAVLINTDGFAIAEQRLHSHGLSCFSHHASSGEAGGK